MKTTQQIVGDASEEKIAQYFHNLGYWAYVLPKKIGGQPFDIIACQEDDTWFLDGKHVESGKKSFEFRRVEPNQETSMMFAWGFAKIKNLGFAIVWDEEPDKIYFLHYLDYKELKRKGEKSVKIEGLKCIQSYLKI